MKSNKKKEDKASWTRKAQRARFWRETDCGLWRRLPFGAFSAGPPIFRELLLFSSLFLPSASIPAPPGSSSASTCCFLLAAAFSCFLVLFLFSEPAPQCARPFTFSVMDEDYSAGSADADREMTRLWRTWRTVFEMLQDRVCDSDSSVLGRGWFNCR